METDVKETELGGTERRLRKGERMAVKGRFEDERVGETEERWFTRLGGHGQRGLEQRLGGSMGM